MNAATKHGDLMTLAYRGVPSAMTLQAGRGRLSEKAASLLHAREVVLFILATFRPPRARARSLEREMTFADESAGGISEFLQ